MKTAKTTTLPIVITMVLETTIDDDGNPSFGYTLVGPYGSSRSQSLSTLEQVGERMREFHSDQCAYYSRREKENNT